jgi:hypothetical protein
MEGLAARGCRSSRPVPDWRGGSHQGRSVNQGMEGRGGSARPTSGCGYLSAPRWARRASWPPSGARSSGPSRRCGSPRCCSRRGRGRTRHKSCTGPTWPRATSSSGCTGSATGGSARAWSSRVWRRNSSSRRGCRGYCVSSLKERGRSIPAKKIVSVLCAVPSVQAGSRQPAGGVRVERPQRSEDERPWDRQGLTQDASGGGKRSPELLSLLQVDGQGRWQLHCQQPLAVGSPRFGCRSSLRRAGRHGAVRPQPGGLNQAGDHAARRGS